MCSILTIRLLFQAFPLPDDVEDDDDATDDDESVAVLKDKMARLQMKLDQVRTSGPPGSLRGSRVLSVAVIRHSPKRTRCKRSSTKESNRQRPKTRAGVEEACSASDVRRTRTKI